MSHTRKLSGLVLAALMLVMLVPLAAAQMTPSVTVSDQAIVNGKVTVEKVVSDGPGWMVIHAQADGKPGPVLGFSPVADGENSNVVVEIDATGATGTLYAMLHTDAGQVGTYEFPGDDVPAKMGDAIITPPFQVTSGLPATLPETGGVVAPWTSILLLAVGGLVLVSGLGLALVRRTR